MSLDVTPVGPVSFGAARDVAPREPRLPADAAAISSGDVPASPPAEVLDAIDGAAARYHELRAQGRELSFAVGEERGVSVEVRDLDGELLHTLAPSALLDVATGGSVE